MIDLGIDVVELANGRYQARVFLKDAPAGTLFLTPVPRNSADEVTRDARAWIWAHYPDSNFGSLAELD